jgi:hypothetical protein
MKNLVLVLGTLITASFLFGCTQSSVGGQSAGKVFDNSPYSAEAQHVAKVPDFVVEK